MKDKKEKMELSEWLKLLMEYAGDNKLPMRISDGISDCMKMVETQDSDRDEINAAVEELLESISQKADPVKKNAADEKGSSLEEIREQIAGMAKRCQTENAESLQNIREREKAIIRKTYCDLQEITYCEAHISELKNNDEYFGFYERIRSSYEKQALHVFREFLSDLPNNYQFMIDHMKSMFRSICGENSGFVSRRFYEEHDIKREGIAGKLEMMAQDADCGGKDIEEFGNATKKRIRKIVQRNVLRMRFLIVLPVLSIILLMGAGIVLKYVRSEDVPDKAAKEQETKELPGFPDEVENVVGDAVQNEAKKEIEEKGIGEIMKVISSLTVTAGAVVVFLVLLIIVIYTGYILSMKKMCDRRIGKKCSTYLQMELSQFRQRDPLLQKMDAVLIDLQEEYDKQYSDLLNQLFCKTDHEISEDGNKDRFEVLKEEWSAIKYG